ncbi:MAG: Unknown protein [uncultured Sulfurovum sp.]|uniref:Uncharacterized protein n=1 Tax=uncultured Sulfurovum sp. TaxID=269237 RepID=A0A6S6T292_9BACT|nr:MAG: Unknown protein [uncultured Sulfurovum sp.]
MLRLWSIWMSVSVFTLAEDNISEILDKISNNVYQAPQANLNMTVGDLGSFFEGTSAHISNLITFYSILISGLLALFSIIYFLKSSGIIKKIENNKEYIRKKHEDLEVSMKDEVKREIDRQLIYNAQNIMKEVQNDAYRKIDSNIEEIRVIEQKKLFDYQQLVYKVIQVKKYAIEEFIHNKELSDHDILLKFVNIEGRYNETLNHDLPNLFSTEIQDIVIPTIKKLSEFTELKEIIAEHVNQLLEKDLAYTDKSKLQQVLKHYKYL